MERHRFANPAITVRRTLSNTFAAIAPASVPGFIAAQLAGATIAVLAIRALDRDIEPADAQAVVLPRAS